MMHGLAKPKPNLFVNFELHRDEMFLCINHWGIHCDVITFGITSYNSVLLLAWFFFTYVLGECRSEILKREATASFLIIWICKIVLS